jgi:hypothetical protein
MDEHRRARELMGPYLQGGLDAQEEDWLRGHLEGCAGCAAELEEVRQAHDLLAGASVPPPPELKGRVLSRLPKRRRKRRRWQVAMAAAALFLIFLVGAVLPAVLTPPGEEAAASLAPTDLASGAGGEVRLREDGANAQVRMRVWGLPPRGADGYYELWFVKGEDRVSGGTFSVDSSGRADVDLSVPASVPEEYRGIGVTAEETSGDPGPSPEKVLGGELGKV